MESLLLCLAAASLAVLLSDLKMSGTVNNWLRLVYHPSGFMNLVYENSAVGTLSHDNKFVYVVDDLALPPHPQTMMYGFNGGMGSNPFGTFTDQVLYNTLMAIELDNGKLNWEIGERKPGGKMPVINNPNFGGGSPTFGDVAY